MDARLIQLYNEELIHLQSEAGEFRREHSDRAKRLALDENRTEDPYVQRLLDGVAYLAARVRLKIDAQYPVFTQQLLEVLFPGWLDPSPSCCVLELTPDHQDSKVAGGVVVPRRSRVNGGIRGRSDIRCDFETAANITLWPIKAIGLTYVAARPSGVTRQDVLSGLTLELEWLGEGGLRACEMDSIRLFIRRADAYGSQLMELLAGRCCGVRVTSDATGRNELGMLPGTSVSHVGFGEDEALFRVPVRGHAGFRILKEYAAFPDRFRFVEIQGLKELVRRATGNKVSLHFHFTAEFRRLEGVVNVDSIGLHCVPAVNARECSLARVDLSPGQMEYRLVGDGRRDEQTEVLSVLQVIGGGGGIERTFRPVFDVAASHRAGTSYYALRRERRAAPQSETRGRSASYLGTDLYISLSEAGIGPHGKDLRSLSIQALCSNRNQPLFLLANFSDSLYEFVESVPVKAVRCVAGPSEPAAPSVDGIDPWVGLSQLFVNYLSLQDTAGERGADALRAMLHLYVSNAGHHLMRQADGLVSVKAEQITRRVPGGGPLAFGRGVGIKLSMSDRAFDGGSPFMLAAVLEHYLATHVAVNSFTETTLELVDRAERISWPVRFGRRPTY